MRDRHRRMYAIAFSILWLASCAGPNAVAPVYSAAQGGVLCAAGGQQTFYILDTERSCIMVYRCARADGDSLQLLSARNYSMDLQLEEYPAETALSVKQLKPELGTWADQAKVTGTGVSAIVYPDPSTNLERIAVLVEAARRLMIYELSAGDRLRLVACRNVRYDAGVMEIRNERPSILDIRQRVETERVRTVSPK